MKDVQITKSERWRYRRKILEQRIIGLLMLACCGLVLWLCSTGTTLEDRDATAVVLLAPLGLWMLFTKQIVIDEVKTMYSLFIGDYERVMGMTVYYKKGKEYIPCIVTNYYFKSRKYALVPIKDLENAPSERRVIYTTKIYTT